MIKLFKALVVSLATLGFTLAWLLFLLVIVFVVLGYLLSHRG